MAGTNLKFYRVPKVKNYTCITNNFLEDPSLSGTAKGVLAYILSCDRKNKNDWILYKEKLIECFSDGKDSINTALDNLIQQGYLEVLKERKGRRTKLFFTVWEIRKSEYELSAECQNDMSGFSNEKPDLCADNPPLLNTYLNTTTNYCGPGGWSSSSSSSNKSENLKRLLGSMNLNVSDDFIPLFKSFAESNNLTEEQSEDYLKWIYETRKKTAHNINSFIYKTACKQNLLDEYLGATQKKTESEKKVFCKSCGKEQTFQEQREASCHGCGKDYFDFSQFINNKLKVQEEEADGNTSNE